MVKRTLTVASQLPLPSVSVPDRESRSHTSSTSSEMASFRTPHSHICSCKLRHHNVCSESSDVHFGRILPIKVGSARLALGRDKTGSGVNLARPGMVFGERSTRFVEIDVLCLVIGHVGVVRAVGFSDLTQKHHVDLSGILCCVMQQVNAKY